MSADPSISVFKAGDLWGWGCATCRASDGTYEMRAHAMQGARNHRCVPVEGQDVNEPPSVDPEEKP